jgi:ketosteroid isomerase-like protein
LTGLRSGLASTCLTLALLSAPAQAADAAAADDPGAAFEHFIAAFNALDWNSFRATFADDASVFNPDIPEVVTLHRLDGRADLERVFQGMFAPGSASPHIVPEDLRIQRFGDTAVISFEFRRPHGSFGRRTVVMNRENGLWLIVHIHA